MIRVTIEVLPDDRSQRRQIGQVDISNTGEGYPLVDYAVAGTWEYKTRGHEIGTCTIQHHPDDSVIRLVANAMKGLAEL